MRVHKRTERFFPAVILFLMVLLAGTVVFAAEQAGVMMKSYGPIEEPSYQATITKVVDAEGLDKETAKKQEFKFLISYPDGETEGQESLSVNGGSSKAIPVKDWSADNPVKVRIKEDPNVPEIRGYDFGKVSYRVKKTVSGETNPDEGTMKIYIVNDETTKDVLTVTRKDRTASGSEADEGNGITIVNMDTKEKRDYVILPGETKSISSLPEGNYEVKPSLTSETKDFDKDYIVKLVREYKGDENGVEVTIEENAKIEIIVTNTYIKKGNLKVEKVWTGDEEEDRPDEIEVQLLQDGNEYEEPVILKKGNWSYTWDDLPAMNEAKTHVYQYSVKEIAVPEGYEVAYSLNNKEGVSLATASDASRDMDSKLEETDEEDDDEESRATPSKAPKRAKTKKHGRNTASSSDVEKDEDKTEGMVPVSAVITITNTKPYKEPPKETPKTGALTIKKRVVGGPEKAGTKKYFFSVEGPSYKDKAAEIMIEFGNEKEKEITLQNLEPGEYTVTEIKKDSVQEEGYVLSVTGEGNVTVKAGFAGEMTITNTYNASKTGSLLIKKTVGGSGDKEKQFHFTISLKDENGNALPGKYSYSGSYEGTMIDGATVVLRHDQSVTVVGLPENAQYKVVEQEANADGYTTTLESGAGSDEGKIVAGETKTVHFHNTKGSGGNNNPPSPTTPPRRGSRDPKPSNPGLPDSNDPNSPEQVTIVEDGVPTTYVKTWDPETEEYFYVPEDEVPLAPLPRTGDPSHTGMLVVLMVVSLIGIAAFSVLRFRRKR